MCAIVGGWELKIQREPTPLHVRVSLSVEEEETLSWQKFEDRILWKNSKSDLHFFEVKVKLYGGVTI